MSPSAADVRRTRAAGEAAQWLLRLAANDMTSAERGEFLDWLRESPVHVAEMLRMEALSACLTEHQNWPVITAESLTTSNVVELIGRHRQPESVTFADSRRWHRAAGIAAVLAVVSICGLMLHWHFASVQIQTHAGERRELTLADGSVVRLSANTHLQVDMQSNVRSIVLREGEAVFHVTRDPSRPFIVNAAATSVRAVGTVFAVARNADAVVVTVAEGHVAVAATHAVRGKTQSDQSPPINLHANERVSISAVGIAGLVQHVDAPLVPAWDDTQLVFENLPVAEVVARFNRRNRLQLHVADDALAARLVSGMFDASDPQSFVDFLTTIAGASNRRIRPDLIVVEPGAPGAGPDTAAH